MWPEPLTAPRGPPSANADPPQKTGELGGLGLSQLRIVVSTAPTKTRGRRLSEPKAQTAAPPAPKARAQRETAQREPAQPESAVQESAVQPAAQARESSARPAARQQARKPAARSPARPLARRAAPRAPRRGAAVLPLLNAALPFAGLRRQRQRTMLRRIRPFSWRRRGGGLKQPVLRQAKAAATRAPRAPAPQETPPQRPPQRRPRRLQLPRLQERCLR
mmetsp:Transcript_14573/g.48865  ORF Transcript_14573/g.48865 Transcript_14573/m.48865 type:complete len:220 (-) Transcript_14573:264-923(-)